MSDELLRREVNTLLALLRQLGVVELVRAYFQQYKNGAPPALLEDAMARVQQIIERRDPAKGDSEPG